MLGGNESDPPAELGLIRSGQRLDAERRIPENWIGFEDLKEEEKARESFGGGDRCSPERNP